MVLGLGVAAFGTACGREGASRESPSRDGASVDEAAGSLSTCVDGDRALEHVRRIVGFGPRHAGSEGIRKTRGYIVAALRELGLEPTRQELVAEGPGPAPRQVPMVNILVDVPGRGGPTVILGGHYDAKRLPGRKLPAANDGGSSVGLLLEMARCLTEVPGPTTVRIAFVDGEESLGEGGPPADGLYGSRHLAASLRESGELEEVAAAIVIDMIGDRRLSISRELESTPWLWRLVAEKARVLGVERHFSGPLLAVVDDHTPLLAAGIPSLLLIDLHYGPGWDDNSYWHTEEDTVDKLSARSFEIVGSVLLASLEEIGSRPAG